MAPAIISKCLVASTRVSWLFINPLLTRDRFERELEALRKELAEANQRAIQQSPALTADDTSTTVSPILGPTSPQTPSPPMLPTLGAPVPPIPALETMSGQATISIEGEPSLPTQ